MPHTPSAAKRLRKSEARRKQNRAAAKKIKTQRKASDVALKANDAAKATEYKTTQTILDRAADKGYIHKNKAARLKSRLVKRARGGEGISAFPWTMGVSPASRAGETRAFPRRLHVQSAFIPRTLAYRFRTGSM